MRNPKFQALLDELLNMHNNKNHDYATDDDPLSNLRGAARLGVNPVTGVIIRLSDKWARIEQLAAGKVPKNESLRDSLMDNAAYSLLAVQLLDEQDALR
jgi:hypothetical protein